MDDETARHTGVLRGRGITVTLDPQHVAEHNLMIANLHAQCARFGLTPTSGGPYTVGDPDHIGEHGRYLDDLLTIEITAGQTFTKPIPNTNPVHGQTGHITDHEDLNAWIQEASTWAAWNDASGGTVTEIDDYNGSGERWRVHTFTSSGSLDISLAVKPFRVLVVGGGGGHGAPSAGGGGGGGVNHQQSVILAAQSYPVVVDGGHATQFVTPGKSTFAGFEAQSGYGGQGNGNGANGGASGAPTSNGGGAGDNQVTGGGGGGAGSGGASYNGSYHAPGGQGITNDIRGTNETYGQGGRGSMFPGGASAGKGTGMPGTTGGGVVVAYQIG